MKTIRFLFTISLLAMALMFSCSSETDSSTGLGPVEAINKFEAEPTHQVGNDRIKYSYSYNGYDFYYIYLGELRNIPLFSYPAEYHDGTKTTYTVSKTETIKETISETIVDNIKTTINVIDEHTYSTTNKQKVSAEIKTSAGWGPVKAEAKAAAEASWEQYTYDKNTSNFQQTTSLTNTITNGTEYTKTTMISRSWELNKDNKIGYYKYTLFSASDVYLYVIKDATGVIYYEFKECVIPDVYFWRFDYSETPSFRKSDATSFEFDVSMLDNLPKPNINLTNLNYTLATNATVGGSVERIPNMAIYKAGTQVTLTAKPNNNYVFDGWTGDLPADVNASSTSIIFAINSDITLTANFRSLVQKTETVEYTTAGDKSYTFNKIYPGTKATVDVWVLGGGGGGQGGHRWQCGLINCDGTGGGGGGGAAAYANFEVTEPVTFSTTVGNGGSAGSYGTTKAGGGNGGAGGYSRITASGGAAFILTAGGGGGGGTTSSGCASGGQNAQNYGCGAGGSASQSGISSTSSASVTLKTGNYGSFGSESDNAPVGGGGGNGGEASGYSGGSGGIGGYGTSGTGSKQRLSGAGGTGKIRIVIKYFE